MLTIESSVAKLSNVRCAWAVIRNGHVGDSAEDLKSEFRSLETRIASELTLENLSMDPGVAESRRCFKMLGLDPARYRPAQEALLRRLLSGKGMNWINSGVDLNNLLSVKHRAPMGLYDLDKIVGDVRLKVGTTNDVYDALNGRPIVCDRKVVTCDTLGPFGSPYVDSLRTSVTSDTKNFLHVVYFCYKGLGPEAFDDMVRSFGRFLGCDPCQYTTM